VIDHATLKNKHAALEGKHTAGETKYTALEAKHDALEAKLAALENKHSGLTENHEKCIERIRKNNEKMREVGDAARAEIARAKEQEASRANVEVEAALREARREEERLRGNTKKAHRDEIEKLKATQAAEVTELRRELNQLKSAQESQLEQETALRQKLQELEGFAEELRRLRTKAEKHVQRHRLDRGDVDFTRDRDNVSFLRCYVGAVQARLDQQGVTEPQENAVVAGRNRPRASASTSTHGTPARPSPAGAGTASPADRVAGVKRPRPSASLGESESSAKKRQVVTPDGPPPAVLKVWCNARLQKLAPVGPDGTRTCDMCQWVFSFDLAETDIRLEYRSKEKKAGITIPKDKAKVFPIVSDPAAALGHLLTKHTSRLRHIYHRP
jgi:predicted  nucleic acid-binding Zn-ribbon protein